MTTTATFAAARRTLRKRQGYTNLDSLSEALARHGHHAKRSALGDIESGKAGVSLERAAAIAAVLGVPLADMLVPMCETCAGDPPAGFTCNTCGVAA